MQLLALEPMFRRGEISADARDALQNQLKRVKSKWTLAISEAVNSFPACRFGEAIL